MGIKWIELNAGIFKIRFSPPIKDLLRHPNMLPSVPSKWLSEESGGAIKFKIFSYTSQSTLSMVCQALTQGDDIVKDRNIEIQLLRPNLQKPLKIWNVHKKNDKRYWHAVKSDAEALDRVWLKIADDPHGKKVNVEICLHPFDPQFKAIFINDKHALLGFYVLEKHTKKVLPQVTSWDYIGYKVKMMELHNSDKGDSSYLFSWALDFFDKTWENFSKPVI